MTTVPGYTAAVNEFIQQAQTWLTQAAAAAQASAAKVEAGTYTMADANADAVKGATLVASGWMGWFAACLDAATVITMPASTTAKVTTPPFSTATPATADSPLALTGPLVSPKGDQIPASKVTFKPDKLAAGTSSFTLEIDAAGLPIGIYFGEATATPATGAAQKVALVVTIA